MLALGSGANTAIFSVINAALLRLLPLPDADRLVRVYEAFDEPDTRANTLNLSERTHRSPEPNTSSRPPSPDESEW